MDDTPLAESALEEAELDDAINRLADVDPADAPDVAENIARTLGDELDTHVEGVRDSSVAPPGP